MRNISCFILIQANKIGMHVNGRRKGNDLFYSLRVSAKFNFGLPPSSIVDKQKY